MVNEKNFEIYRNCGSYAREHGEIEKWRESKAVTGTKCLDFGIGKGCLINIVTGSDR